MTTVGSESSYAFPKSCTGNESQSGRAMAADGTAKVLVSPLPSEFQHQNCTVGSLHDSDHDSVVRIFVGSYL